MKSDAIHKFSELNYDKKRILAFCWNNPILEENFINFINKISNIEDILPIFIVPTLLSKLRFLIRDMHAFTYQELITYSSQFGISVDYKYSGFERQILTDLSEYDKALRWEWVPNPNLTEEEFYVYQSSKILNAYNFIWQNFKPHLAITWNGVTLFQKALAFLARTYDVPVLFLERGLLPQTLYVDTEGVNYKSSIAGKKWSNITIPYPDKKGIKIVKDYCRKLKEEKKSVVDTGTKISVEELKKKLAIRDSSKVILFPMQIEADSNILYYSPHYSNMIDIIKDIQRAITRLSNKEINLIVKPHPEDKNRLNELQSLTNKTTHILENVNLYSLLELADLVICVNSTVGLEALIFRKPVIVLGKAIYSEKGFTYDLPNRQKLTNFIRLALTKHIFNEKEFYRFLVHILEHKLFHLSPSEDPWNSRGNIVTEMVNLLETQESTNITDNKIIVNKLSENLKLKKMCNSKKILILGSIDKNIEKIIDGSDKKIEKLVNVNKSLKILLNSLVLGKRPDLIITNKYMSFKKLLFLKLIRSRHKMLLGKNEILFS